MNQDLSLSRQKTWILCQTPPAGRMPVGMCQWQPCCAVLLCHWLGKTLPGVYLRRRVVVIPGKTQEIEYNIFRRSVWQATDKIPQCVFCSFQEALAAFCHHPLFRNVAGTVRWLIFVFYSLQQIRQLFFFFFF